MGEDLYGYGSTVVLTMVEKGDQREWHINCARLREVAGYSMLSNGFFYDGFGVRAMSMAMSMTRVVEK